MLVKLCPESLLKFFYFSQKHNLCSQHVQSQFWQNIVPIPGDDDFVHWEEHAAFFVALPQVCTIV